MSTAERFWAKVNKTDECWHWVGGHNGAGYGRFSVAGHLVYAHRWSYEAAHGPIEEGLVIDHLCRTPDCVRPSHMEAVTPGQNNSRGLLGFELTGKCRSGAHDITDPGNVIHRSDGRKQCRPCFRLADASRREATA